MELLLVASNISGNKFSHAGAADRVFAAVMNSLRIRARAAAEAEHCVLLASVWRCGRLRGTPPAKHSHRKLLVAFGKQQLPARTVEDSATVIPLARFASQPCEWPHVQRIEVELFR